MSSGRDDAARENASTSGMLRLPSATAESVTLADVGTRTISTFGRIISSAGSRSTKSTESVVALLLEHCAELTAGESSEPALVPPGRGVHADRQRHWLTPRDGLNRAPANSPAAQAVC